MIEERTEGIKTQKQLIEAFTSLGFMAVRKGTDVNIYNPVGKGHQTCLLLKLPDAAILSPDTKISPELLELADRIKESASLLSFVMTRRKPAVCEPKAFD